MSSNLPIFYSSEVKPNLSLPAFERGVAVICLKNTDKYIVYDRNDSLWRFPGGHVESGETPRTSAIRETEEEVGLKNLQFIKNLGSCHNFFLFKDQPSHVIEHYFLFTTTLENWKNKLNDEEGINSSLKTKPEILSNNWPQVEWILKMI